MKLTSEEVKHIAKLARLKLTHEEVEKFGQQLSGILSNAKTLEEVDTSKVEPIAQITGLKNVTFEDKEQPCELANKLLEQSPMPIQDHMIKVKNVF
jgi:aspartyl-tRNA(Asn)/glutamyl-tRNA(Gln) amidotransferase subunit C